MFLKCLLTRILPKTKDATCALQEIWDNKREDFNKELKLCGINVELKFDNPSGLSIKLTDKPFGKIAYSGTREKDQYADMVVAAANISEVFFENVMIAMVRRGEDNERKRNIE